MVQQVLAAKPDGLSSIPKARTVVERKNQPKGGGAYLGSKFKVQPIIEGKSRHQELTAAGHICPVRRRELSPPSLQLIHRPIVLITAMGKETNTPPPPAS